jgi:hypothetical protein
MISEVIAYEQDLSGLSVAPEKEHQLVVHVRQWQERVRESVPRTEVLESA